ncbi:hypothetical protein [Nostoc sp.]|uniref:hypothetical protein n=1 Tax=Nostoc sp. TaxID=1180 RepID=UPI002FF2F35E
MPDLPPYPLLELILTDGTKLTIEELEICKAYPVGKNGYSASKFIVELENEISYEVNMSLVGHSETEIIWQSWKAM